MTAPVPDDEPLSEDDASLFRFLDQQVYSGDFERTVVPCETPSQEDLPGLVKCLRLLEGLAGTACGSESARFEDRRAGESSVLQLPRQFGPYTLEAELGRGGMGVVYRAVHETLGSAVAIKMIRASEFASDEEVRRFFQEARAASRLRHPHIVSVHDAGEWEGLPFLAMDYIAGGTLAERIQDRRVSVDEAATLMKTIAESVHYLHQHGIVHRDLKPSNILLDETGQPCVTDFGLAKVFTQDAARTATGTVIGTPAYMSPEQAWGTPDDVSARSDIYSLGALLYELLTGRPPFPGDNPLDQLLGLRDADPVIPRVLNRAVPVDLELICLRCLEKNPEHRYESAQRLAEDLERYLNREPVALPSLGLLHGLQHWIRREPPLVSHLGALVIMALIVQGANWVAGEMRPQYTPVMTLLAGWALCSVVLQKLLHRDVTGVRFIWVALDAVLFTVAMTFAERPLESLMVGYALLIVASALWFRPYLVWLMTAASVLAYGLLFKLRGAEMTPLHYPYIVAGILIVIGAIMALLIREMQVLWNMRARNRAGS